MNKIIILVVLILFSGDAFGCMNQALTNNSFVVEGLARNLLGESLYIEKLNRVSGKNGGTLSVDYFNPEGTLIAKKFANFNCNPTTPSFQLIDIASGITEGVRWMDSEVENYNDQSSEKLSIPRGAAIVDAGFDHAIKLSWDQLMLGNAVKFKYFFPREGKFIKLRFTKTSAPKITGISPDDDTIFFKISANNLLFRMLSSPIYVGYQQTTKSLKYYIGPSNLPTMNSEKQVIISYGPITSVE